MACLGLVQLGFANRQQERANPLFSHSQNASTQSGGAREVPDSAAPRKPGSLIRSEAFDGYAIPYSVSALRILYYSHSAQGQDVPASAVILFPARTAPAGGWPIVAWAHPFVGAAKSCAPSLMKSLYAGTLLSMYVNMGYAVVAPDYVGLGTSSRHAALDAQSNAIDLIYAVRAARSAAPQLSAKWVVTGEREGGLIALVTDESVPDNAYLGSIAVNPTLDLKAEIESLDREGEDALAVLAYGLKTLYPDFDEQHFLPPSSRSDYNEIVETCSFAHRTASHRTSGALDAELDTNPYVTKFLNRNALGSGRAHGPMLLVTAHSALTHGGVQTIGRMCRQGDEIDVQYYDAPADDLMGESASYQTSWLHARFSGLRAPSNCRTLGGTLKY